MSKKKTDKEILDKIVQKILREKKNNPRLKKIAINLRKLSAKNKSIILADVVEDLEMYIEGIYEVLEIIHHRMPKQKFISKGD